MDVGMARRIAVIGSPGAGKSTLATRLAAVTGLPLIHLDQEYWQPGWLEPDPAAWRATSAALAAGERWVIDGNYGGSLPVRLERADLVIWLDLPTRTCLASAIRRLLTNRGTVRPDMREGCPERFNAAFLLYVLAFRRRKRPDMERALAEAGLPMIRLTSAAERTAFGQVVARLASSRIEMP